MTGFLAWLLWGVVPTVVVSTVGWALYAYRWVFKRCVHCGRRGIRNTPLHGVKACRHKDCWKLQPREDKDGSVERLP
jgi:hypothetical protein